MFLLDFTDKVRPILLKQLRALSQAYAINNLVAMQKIQDQNGFQVYTHDLNKPTIDVDEPSLGITVKKGLVTVKDPSKAAAWQRLGEIYDEQLSEKTWYTPYKNTTSQTFSSFKDYLRKNHPAFLPPTFQGLTRSMKVLGNFGVNPAVDSVVFFVKNNELQVRAIVRAGDNKCAFVGGMGQGIDKAIDEILEERFSGALFTDDSSSSKLLNGALSTNGTAEKLYQHIITLLKNEKAPTNESSAKEFTNIVEQFEKLKVLAAASRIQNLANALISIGEPSLSQLATHILVEAYKKGLPEQYTQAVAIFKNNIIETEQFPNTADPRNTDDAYMATSMYIMFAEAMFEDVKKLESLGLKEGAGDDAVAIKTLTFEQFLDDAFSNHGPMAIDAFCRLLKNNKLSEQAGMLGTIAIGNFLQKNPVLQVVAECEAVFHEVMPFAAMEAYRRENAPDSFYGRLHDALLLIAEHGNKYLGELPNAEQASFHRLNNVLFGGLDRKDSPGVTTEAVKADVAVLDSYAARLISAREQAIEQGVQANERAASTGVRSLSTTVAPLATPAGTVPQDRGPVQSPRPGRN